MIIINFISLVKLYTFSIIFHPPILTFTTPLSQPLLFAKINRLLQLFSWQLLMNVEFHHILSTILILIL